MPLTYARALVNAVATERSGARFYLGLARNVKDPEARRLFEEMSAEEESHAQSLMDLAERAFGQVPADMDVEPLTEDPLAARVARETDMDVFDAVEIALDAEQDAVRSYAELAWLCQQESGVPPTNRGGDPTDACSLFERIAREEERHVQVLEALQGRLVGEE